MKSVYLVAAILCSLLSTAGFAQTFDSDALVAEFDALARQATASGGAEHWVQPRNHAQKCAVLFRGNQVPVSTNWYGDCANGKARGLGVTTAVFDGDQSKTVLEEYADGQDVVYRIIVEGKQGTLVFSGTADANESLGRWLRMGPRSADGVAGLDVIQAQELKGVTLARMTNALTGQVTYGLTRGTQYALYWSITDAAQPPVLELRTLSINGALRARTAALDGFSFDNAINPATNQSSFAQFGPALSTLLRKPYVEYLRASDRIEDAIAVSDEKFAAANKKFCVTGEIKNEDVANLCDPSLLEPSEADLVVARENADRRLQSEVSAVRTAIAQIRLADESSARRQEKESGRLQAQLAAQQAEIAELNRQKNVQALRDGFDALNKMGKSFQDAASQMNKPYQAPQVQTPSLRSPNIMHCRTIGYITTCN